MQAVSFLSTCGACTPISARTLILSAKVPLICLAGYTYAAGLNAMRGATRMLGAPPGSSFEVFGVDMLVDTDFRPWLVEINAVPSLARKVCTAQQRA